MKEPFRKEIWCLLKRNISKGQLLGYALANVVGLSVILIGTLFYADSQHSNSDSDAFFSEDYIVLSKKVDGIGFTPVRFTSDDISNLEQQKWVQKVGKFSVSQFAVNGSVDMGGRGLSTYLFFESVPDEFFDVLPSGWYFKPEEKFVPIIMSRDYLTLYNFGFAIPQGLPQVSDKMVGAVPITLQLTGEGNVTETYSAAVVGFSSRLNTIAVPQSFMDWANKRYYSGPPQEPSRLIVSVVATNGVVISALALFILTLSIFLLLQKSKDTIRKLMFMGFPPLEISRYYETIVIGANTAITLIATAATLCCRQLWKGQLEEIGLGGSSVLPTLFLALAYLFLVSAFNVIVIRRRLYGIWKN